MEVICGLHKLLVVCHFFALSPLVALMFLAAHQDIVMLVLFGSSSSLLLFVYALLHLLVLVLAHLEVHQVRKFLVSLLFEKGVILFGGALNKDERC